MFGRGDSPEQVYQKWRRYVSFRMGVGRGLELLLKQEDTL